MATQNGRAGRSIGSPDEVMPRPPGVRTATPQRHDDLLSTDSEPKRGGADPERDSAAAARARTTASGFDGCTSDEVARVTRPTAAARDSLAETRDQAADVRDRAAEQREQRAAEAGDLDEAIATARTLRDSGGAVRHQAALERLAAADDREHAEADRRQAASDRSDAGLDESTGIFRRSTGQLALTHEIDRSRRSGSSLVLAVIRVDDLRAVNDS